MPLNPIRASDLKTRAPGLARALGLARAFRPIRSFGRFACLAVLFGTAGCAGLNDPFQREGTWQPEGLNRANLAAMVANPRHLEQGVNDDASPGVLSAAAVHRLLTDKVKPLSTDNVGPIQSAAPAGGTGGGAP
jgi:hypothetical protein